MHPPDYYLGKPVRSLQTMLRHISEADARVLPVIPNGFYGKSTYASVRSFQQAYGIPDTGIADSETWSNIASAHTQVLPARFSPTITPIWNVNRALTAGESNDHLYLVQAMLIVLSKYFSEIPVPSPNGKLDDVTMEGLRYLQKAGGLTATGLLDTETWHLLSGLYRTMTGTGTPANSSFG